MFIRFVIFPSVHVLRILAAVAWSVACGRAADTDFQVLEGEVLKVLKHTGNAGPQDLRPFGEGAWSGNAHLWWTGAKPGDVLELALPIAADGTYRIGAGMTKAIDYGIFEFSLDGQKLAGPIDLYNNGVVHTGTIALGDAVKLIAAARKGTA